MIGRVTQQDTYHGDGLNLYAYCQNNPVMYCDPTGHDSGSAADKAWQNYMKKRSDAINNSVDKGANAMNNYVDKGSNAMNNAVNNDSSGEKSSTSGNKNDNSLNQKKNEQKKKAEKDSGSKTGNDSSADGTKSKIPSWSGSGPEPGVLGINENSGSNAAIKNYYPKDGGIEFVFDAATNTFVVGKPKYRKGGSSPHQQLANSIGADQGANTTLGGTFSRGPNGEIITTENSGHFGKNWTPELREQFIKVMREYGLEVSHIEW